VLVVKPLILHKTLVRLDAKGGSVLSRRRSPKVETVLSLFDELIYFTRVFPHRNLTLETPLVEVDELRYPGHGRRRRWRENDFLVEDQRLVSIRETHRFKTNQDLLASCRQRSRSRFTRDTSLKGSRFDAGLLSELLMCCENAARRPSAAKLAMPGSMSLSAAGEEETGITRRLTAPKPLPGD